MLGGSLDAEQRNYLKNKRRNKGGKNLDLGTQ